MFIAKDFDSDHEEELVYIAIKDESNDEDNEKMTLISHVSKNDTWIIDSSCPHHMTGDKTKFEVLEDYDGGSVRFENNDAIPHHVTQNRNLLKIEAFLK